MFLNARRIPGEAGTTQLILLAMEDVTERKRAEEALRESESFNRGLVENLPDYIAIYGVDGNLLYVNPASATLLGYSAEKLAGTPVLSYVAEEYRNEVVSRLTDRREGSEIQPYEIDLLTHGGLRRSVIVKGTRIQYRDTPATLLVLTDITDRKLAEDALQKSEHRMRSLIESMNDLVFVLDRNLVFQEYYQHYDAALFIKPEQFIGKSFDEVGFPDLAYGIIKKALMQILQTGNPTSAEYCLDVQKGQLWYDLHVTSFQGSDGTRTGLTCVVRDITDRKRAEEALRQVNKQLNLLSSITRHDILNQLMALKGYIELSRDYLDDKKTLSDFLGKEETAARTIEDQITFTKDYQELGAAAPAWQSVNASIEKAIAGLPMRNIHVEVDPKAPEIFADPLFEKVFYNLIDNALSYGGDQMKTIRVSSQESDTSLAIVCEDDGVGISAKDKKRLFTRGFGKNTGLGLFLSREILGITGITITENGVPGKGARFEIAVPKGMFRFMGTGGK
jgi:PAS domain S-box-containing protein